MSNTIRLVGCSLRELRIHLCQKSPASAGVRNFIENDYVPLKKANPQFPILIRECSGIGPRIFARYDYGEERCIQVENLSREQVAATIKDLATRK